MLTRAACDDALAFVCLGRESCRTITTWFRLDSPRRQISGFAPDKAVVAKATSDDRGRRRNEGGTSEAHKMAPPGLQRHSVDENETGGKEGGVLIGGRRQEQERLLGGTHPSSSAVGSAPATSVPANDLGSGPRGQRQRCVRRHQVGPPGAIIDALLPVDTHSSSWAELPAALSEGNPVARTAPRPWNKEHRTRTARRALPTEDQEKLRLSDYDLGRHKGAAAYSSTACTSTMPQCTAREVSTPKRSKGRGGDAVSAPNVFTTVHPSSTGVGVRTNNPAQISSLNACSQWPKTRSQQQLRVADAPGLLAFSCRGLRLRSCCQTSRPCSNNLQQDALNCIDIGPSETPCAAIFHTLKSRKTMPNARGAHDGVASALTVKPTLTAV